MSKPSDIVSIALAEVGYREKASNTSLDDKTANAGAANWTKYARDLAAAGYYNGNKNGYAWCDVFVDWCFFKAYGAVEGQRIQCQSGPLGAGCIFSAQYYQQKGRYDKNPKVGDQVFFQSGGQIGHTGIVVEVTDSTIVTVEGKSFSPSGVTPYSGSYEAIPRVTAQSLPTQDRWLDRNVVIQAIPYHEVENTERGTTAIIGGI